MDHSPYCTFGLAKILHKGVSFCFLGGLAGWPLPLGEQSARSSRDAPTCHAHNRPWRIEAWPASTASSGKIGRIQRATELGLSRNAAPFQTGLHSSILIQNMARGLLWTPIRRETCRPIGSITYWLHRQSPSSYESKTEAVATTWASVFLMERLSEKIPELTHVSQGVNRGL